MGRDGGDQAGTLLSRYECKYLVTPSVASDIRQFISPFMTLDSNAREGRSYPICSLYLDTFDLHFYRQTLTGEKNRCKLRVRSYSDDSSTPVFLEVKGRVNDIVWKRRAKLPPSIALALLREGDGAWTDPRTRKVLEDLDFFAGHVSVAAARPFLRVKYMREAYEAVGGDTLRITFDTDVMCCPTLDANLSFNGKGWIPTSVPGVILEIKFTERYPAWTGEMIRIFGLQKQSVPKYVLSVDRFFAVDGEGGPRIRRAPRRRPVREIVGKRVGSDALAPAPQATEPERVPSERGVAFTAPGNGPSIAKTAPSAAPPAPQILRTIQTPVPPAVAIDDNSMLISWIIASEDEIVKRLDAIFPGDNGAIPIFTRPSTVAVVAADEPRVAVPFDVVKSAEQDFIAQILAELDAELDSPSATGVFERTPKLEPMTEPIPSYPRVSPSVLEARPVLGWDERPASARKS
jgi:hypothetical protein